MSNDSVKLQGIAVHVLQNTYVFVISRCCFAKDGKEMYEESKRTGRSIVLLIKPFCLVRILFAVAVVVCYNSQLLTRYGPN